MGPVQLAIHYASTHGIPIVTVPVNATCNFPYLYMTRGGACSAINMETGVTLVGLGNNTIYANVLGIQSSILPPKGCIQTWGGINFTSVFNVNYVGAVTSYNGNGTGGYVTLATTAGSHQISFATAGEELNYAVGDYVALFQDQAVQSDSANICHDTCPMQVNLVTAVNSGGSGSHYIMVQDPVEYSFPSTTYTTGSGSYPGPWIRNVTCGKSTYGLYSPPSCTIHDVGAKNFTVNANIFPWNINESWGITFDNITWNLSNCTPCGGGVQDSDQWGINTAMHWTLSNSTLNWQRNGSIQNQEAHQRESGYVLFKNVTIQIPPGDTGGWTSISSAEWVYEDTWDNVTLPNLVRDPTGAQTAAFMIAGSHNTVKNSHITLTGGFNTARCGSPPSCGIVVTSYGNLRGYEGYYTIQNNTITGRADGGAMMSVISSGAAPANSNIVSGNQTKITGGNAYSVVMWIPSIGYTVTGNTNNGAVAGSGMLFNGTGSNCSITNNSNLVMHGGTGCTR
jgi:hypothetical protein